MQDYHLAIKNMGGVYRNDGQMLSGLANRNGWRVDKEGTKKWGGVKIKKDIHGAAPWLHPLAAESLREKTSQMLEDFTICDDVVRNLENTV